MGWDGMGVTLLLTDTALSVCLGAFLFVWVFLSNLFFLLGILCSPTVGMLCKAQSIQHTDRIEIRLQSHN